MQLIISKFNTYKEARNYLYITQRLNNYYEDEIKAPYVDSSLLFCVSTKCNKPKSKLSIGLGVEFAAQLFLLSQ